MFINIEADIQIGIKSLILMNPALICGTIVTAFVLDAMLVNDTIQKALSIIIEGKHTELWCRVRSVCITNGHSCYDMWVIWTAAGTSVNYWSSKLFLSFKAFLELSFTRYCRLTCCKEFSRLLLCVYLPDMSLIEHAWDWDFVSLTILVLSLL